MSINAISTMDFTYSSTDDEEYKAIKVWMIGNCKKWTFQYEEGDSGYLHYQGRFSLKKKRRIQELKAPFAWHLSATSKENTNNSFYVDKEDTRRAGPWRDTDHTPIETKQMEMMKKWGLYPWQKKLTLKSVNFCLRTIDLIFDPTGNCGKSLFSEYMEYNGLAEEVPPYRMMDDLYQWVYGRPTKKCYIFDMPRGLKKDNLGDFYSGIEVIKNGVAYDKRNYPKKKRFDRPRIFVFTNTLPKFSLMSKDRWNLWTIDEDKELIPFKISEEEFLAD
jgi:hypothetical protein